MSKNYTQLRLEQRYSIEALFSAGMSQKFIAQQLKVHPSTISRELRRNTAKRGRTSGEYQALNAQRRTLNRHSVKKKRTIFTESIKERIKYCLIDEKWSPELISKCLEGVPISHEWIYQWIWQCKRSNKRKDKAYKNLYKYLRHGRRRRKRGNIKDSRGIIPNRVSIEKRPLIVAKRKRLGDIEVDLMMGKNHKGALLVMTDRATLETKLSKLEGKDSRLVLKAIKRNIARIGYPIHTMTFDNDKAFSCHQEIKEKMKIQTYFTRPYTSQDKGTVENRIGVIRRYFPKKTDLRNIATTDVKSVEQKLNRRPIRKFNYKTPKQVLLEKLHL
jgi:transposase, IS30 family